MWRKGLMAATGDWFYLKRIDLIHKYVKGNDSHVSPWRRRELQIQKERKLERSLWCWIRTGG